MLYSHFFSYFCFHFCLASVKSAFRIYTRDGCLEFCCYSSSSAVVDKHRVPSLYFSLQCTQNFCISLVRNVFFSKSIVLIFRACQEGAVLSFASSSLCQNVPVPRKPLAWQCPPKMCINIPPLPFLLTCFPVIVECHRKCFFNGWLWHITNYSVVTLSTSL